MPRLSSPLRLVALIGPLLALGACETTIVRDAALATGVAAEPRPAPDFIAGSRPKQLGYMPIGTSAPAQPSAAKSAAEVKAAEAQMDATRAANEGRGSEARAAGATPPPSAAR